MSVDIRDPACRACCVIIVINFIIFGAETLAGGSENTEVARKFGALYVPDLKRGQYYRLFSAMFIHFGVMHLLCNMYSLYALGTSVERLFGHMWFIVIYIISGLCGNLLTVAVQHISHRYPVSAGASGAIFGLMGAVCALAVFPEYRDIVNIKSLVFNIGINLVYGFSNKEINMSAHLGGLAGGALTTAAIMIFFFHAVPGI